MIRENASDALWQGESDDGWHLIFAGRVGG
jgi:hypothetical protein